MPHWLRPITQLFRGKTVLANMDHIKQRSQSPRHVKFWHENLYLQKASIHQCSSSKGYRSNRHSLTLLITETTVSWLFSLVSSHRWKRIRNYPKLHQGMFRLYIEENFSVERCSSPGTGCPGQRWSHHPCRWIWKTWKLKLSEGIRGVEKMCRRVTQGCGFVGFGSLEFRVEPDDLNGLSQPKWSNEVYWIWRGFM